MSNAQKAGSGEFEGTHTSSAAGAVAPNGNEAGLPALGDADALWLDQMRPSAVPSSAAKGRGRPEGSQNKRTNTTFEAAAREYGDPLIATIALGNMSPVDLIRFIRAVASDTGLKMGVTVMDVLRYQRDLRNDAMPYGHGKRTPVTAKGQDALPIIGIGTINQTTNNVVVASGSSLEDALAKHQQKQQVIDNGPEMSHGDKSHETPSD